MGLFDKIKSGLQKTHARLFHEVKRIITRSPKLTDASLDELEALLIASDFGSAMAAQITAAIRKAYETQGSGGVDLMTVAAREVEHALAANSSALHKESSGLTVVSIVGVNGTGKTTTVGKLARLLQNRGEKVHLAACDTFRAAAIEQLKLWGQRIQAPVTAGSYGTDPAAIAHDAISAAAARGSSYVLIDTAGRLHTKQNLMQELQKLHRVLAKKLPRAPHETLLVLDATTGMNALNQAREFHKAVALTGLVISKLDGTSKGGMAVAIQRELNLPIKFVGVGEQPDDLQPFDPKAFAEALFFDKDEG